MESTGKAPSEKKVSKSSSNAKIFATAIKAIKVQRDPSPVAAVSTDKASLRSQGGQVLESEAALDCEDESQILLEKSPDLGERSVGITSDSDLGAQKKSIRSPRDCEDTEDFDPTSAEDFRHETKNKFESVGKPNAAKHHSRQHFDGNRSRDGASQLGRGELCRSVLNRLSRPGRGQQNDSREDKSKIPIDDWNCNSEISDSRTQRCLKPDNRNTKFGRERNFSGRYLEANETYEKTSSKDSFPRRQMSSEQDHFYGKEGTRAFYGKGGKSTGPHNNSRNLGFHIVRESGHDGKIRNDLRSKNPEYKSYSDYNDHHNRQNRYSYDLTSPVGSLDKCKSKIECSRPPCPGKEARQSPRASVADKSGGYANGCYRSGKDTVLFKKSADSFSIPVSDSSGYKLDIRERYNNSGANYTQNTSINTTRSTSSSERKGRGEVPSGKPGQGRRSGSTAESSTTEVSACSEKGGSDFSRRNSVPSYKKNKGKKHFEQSYTGFVFYNSKGRHQSHSHSAASDSNATAFFERRLHPGTRYCSPKDGGRHNHSKSGGREQVVGGKQSEDGHGETIASTSKSDGKELASTCDDLKSGNTGNAETNESLERKVRDERTIIPLDDNKELLGTSKCSSDARNGDRIVDLEANDSQRSCENSIKNPDIAPNKSEVLRSYGRGKKKKNRVSLVGEQANCSESSSSAVRKTEGSDGRATSGNACDPDGERNVEERPHLGESGVDQNGPKIVIGENSPRKCEDVELAGRSGTKTLTLDAVSRGRGSGRRRRGLGVVGDLSGSTRGVTTMCSMLSAVDLKDTPETFSSCVPSVEPDRLEHVPGAKESRPSSRVEKITMDSEQTRNGDAAFGSFHDDRDQRNPGFGGRNSTFLCGADVSASFILYQPPPPPDDLPLLAPVGLMGSQGGSEVVPKEPGHSFPHFFPNYPFNDSRSASLSDPPRCASFSEAPPINAAYLPPEPPGPPAPLPHSSPLPNANAYPSNAQWNHRDYTGGVAAAPFAGNFQVSAGQKMLEFSCGERKSESKELAADMLPSANSFVIKAQIPEEHYRHWMECYIKARDEGNENAVSWCRYYWYSYEYLPSMPQSGSPAVGESTAAPDLGATGNKYCAFYDGDVPLTSSSQVKCTDWKPLDSDVEKFDWNLSPNERPGRSDFVTPVAGNRCNSLKRSSGGGRRFDSASDSGRNRRDGEGRFLVKVERSPIKNLFDVDYELRNNTNSAKKFKTETSVGANSPSPKVSRLKFGWSHKAQRNSTPPRKVFFESDGKDEKKVDENKSGFKVVRKIWSPLNFDPKEELDEWQSKFSRSTQGVQVGYIDSHCHLDLLFRRASHSGSFKEFREKNAETFPANFAGCVTVFCNPNLWNSYQSEDNLFSQLLKEENIWAAVGCHPKAAQDFNARTEMHMRLLLQHDRVKAVGEIGLDFSGTYGQHRDVQIDVLNRQVATAIKTNKPIVIHARDAESEIMEVLTKIVPRDYKIHRHCFLGTWSEADAWLERFPESYIGITPAVTNIKNRSKLRDLLWHLPLNKILLETDAPYFVPSQICNSSMQLSHPGLAVTVAMEIAGVKEIPMQAVLSACLQNTKDMYDL